MKRLWALLLLGALSCGGQKPARAPEPAGSAPPAPPSQEVVAAPMRVSAPQDLVLTGSIRNPRELADTFFTWSGLPFRMQDLLSQRAGGLAEIVAIEQPIDVLALMPERAMKLAGVPAAISVGLHSLEGALASLEKQGREVRRRSVHVYDIGSLLGAECHFGSSLGSTTGRMVCARDAEALSRLLPYGTRGFPNERPSTADVYLEVQAEPIRRKFGGGLERLAGLATLFASQAEVGNPVFDRAVGDAARGVSDEALALAEDLDRLRIELIADREPEAFRVKMGLGFRSSTSWLARSARAQGERVGPPPDYFWHLPSGAKSAGYSLGSEVPGRANIENTLLALVDGGADRLKAPAAVRADLVSALRPLLGLMGERGVAALGFLPSEAAKGASNDQNAGKGFWYIAGLERPAKEWKDALRGLHRAISHPAMKRLAQETPQIKALPKTRLAPAPELGRGAERLEITLPKSLLELHDQLQGETKPAPKDRTVYVAVIPNDALSWLIVSSSSADLKALAQNLTQRKGTLADRTDLGPMKAMKANAASFSSVDYLWGLSERNLHQLFDRALESPALQRSLVFLHSSATAKGAAVEAESTLVIPRETVLAVTAAAVSMGR